eukprot:210511-Hanusia_phi.AAC.2
MRESEEGWSRRKRSRGHERNERDREQRSSVRHMSLCTADYDRFRVCLGCSAVLALEGTSERARARSGETF